MAQVIWTEPALDDLVQIAEYIALSNVNAAKSLVRKVFDKVDRLKAHPESGKIPDELKEFGYLEVVVAPCRIFYKYEAEEVFVLHVMRQERDLRKYLIDS